MIIETFHQGKQQQIYKRVEEKGRMLPEGVVYINSWITEDLSTCYQVMEADNTDKIQEWISHWEDLVDFIVIPVLTSAQAKETAEQMTR
jgi:hypothetical protein